MDEISEEDQLDRQFREAAPYIDDNGFTACVLQQLPAPRRTRRSFRGAILLATALLASALAYIASDGGRFLIVTMERLVALPTVWLFAFALGSGLLVMTAGAIAAIAKASELHP
jgi:hypothetical protein